MTLEDMNGLIIQAHLVYLGVKKCCTIKVGDYKKAFDNFNEKYPDPVLRESPHIKKWLKPDNSSDANTVLSKKVGEKDDNSTYSRCMFHYENSRLQFQENGVNLVRRMFFSLTGELKNAKGLLKFDLYGSNDTGKYGCGGNILK